MSIKKACLLEGAIIIVVGLVLIIWGVVNESLDFWLIVICVCLLIIVLASFGLLAGVYKNNRTCVLIYIIVTPFACLAIIVLEFIYLCQNWTKLEFYDKWKHLFTLALGIALMCPFYPIWYYKQLKASEVRW